LKRIGRVIFPTIVVVTAIAAFGAGSHCRLMRQVALIHRSHLIASNGPWLRQAQGDGNIQKSGASGRSVADDNLTDIFQSDSPYTTFQNVYQLLKDDYVEGIPSDTPLAYGAAAAMLASLDDPNSRYIEPVERKAFDQQEEGIYQGAGIIFTVRKAADHSDPELVVRKITTVAVVPGSPAQKAGIKTGDVITEIDHHWIISYDPIRASSKIFKKLGKDEVGLEKAYTAIENKIVSGINLAKAQSILDVTRATPLVLSVERTGEAKPLSFTLDISQPTKADSVSFRKLNNGSGYIHIFSFNSNTVADFDKALAGVASDNGIIVDLRDCPGGDLSPAVTIANSFVPGAELGRIEVKVAHAKDANANLGFATKVEPLKSEKPVPAANIYHGKIVVLVNNATANTAELLAEFFHDRLGARIAGQTTFGDGSAQTLFPMSDHSAFTLTTGVLQTDNGKPFNLSGIVPDVPLADAAVRGADDPCVVKAESLLDLPPLKIEAIKPSEPPVLSL